MWTLAHSFRHQSQVSILSFPKTVQVHQWSESQWFERNKKSVTWGSIFFFPRSETLTLKKLRTLPKGQRRICSALDLTDIQRVYNGEECYLSGCLWNSCDGGKMGRRLQFLDMDRDIKAQILCADNVVISMGSDQVFDHLLFH